MGPSEDEWLTIAEAARQLGLQQSSLRGAIRRGRLAARKMGRRNRVSVLEVERYRREHLGQRSWQHRRDPDYQPSPAALWQRRHRERMKAQNQDDQRAASTEATRVTGGTGQESAS